MSAMRPSRQLWAQGPHIVAIGGGTGLSTMLRGLKKYTKNLTAIVTVSDAGGGSGMLRRDIGMLPPGDIRHCMESLANTEPVMQQLLTYRFESGTLRGQCFGNLLLAALNGVTGSFDEAVRSMGQVLAISGTVIPVTTTDVRLTATFENGAYVVGESNIFGFKKQQDCRIDHVELLPAHPKALPDALDAIAAGIALVRAQKAQGVQLLATGEMGIGNTTTSSAVAAVLLGPPVALMHGHGARHSEEGLATKVDAI